MCVRNQDNTLTLCEPAKAATGRGFPLGSWVSREGFGIDEPVQNHAVKSGEFSRGAGIKINFCPFTGLDVRPIEDQCDKRSLSDKLTDEIVDIAVWELLEYGPAQDASLKLYPNLDWKIGREWKLSEVRNLMRKAIVKTLGVLE